MNFDRQPTLKNELVSIVPLQADDFDALYQVAKDPLLWAQHTAKDRYTRSVFKVFFEQAISSGGALKIIDNQTREVIGSSRFQLVDGHTDKIEIGWTFLARKYWGGTYNAAIKTLMIQHAFQYVPFVLLFIAKENLRSQSAARKIGAIQLNDPTAWQIHKKVGTHFVFVIGRFDVDFP